MLSLSEAQAALISRLAPGTRTETVPLAMALGRYTASPVLAHVDNPAFDNSAMDGYAVSTADLARRKTLPLHGEAACGSAPGVMTPNSAMRIFTGAPLPAGADAVVMQEDVTRNGGLLAFPADVKPGSHIRRRGEDFQLGEKLLDSGRRLTPYDVALLAAAGHGEVKVVARPRVLVIATGDELVTPGHPLQPGQIYESNRLPTLMMLEALGAEAVDGGIVRDDVATLRELLAKTQVYDFVITSGGASVGDHDLVKQVFGELGEIGFWKVKIKPGKPIAFGRLGKQTHFFALPGNPVSSLVTFKLFVEPAIYAWHRAVPPGLGAIPAIAQGSFQRKPGRMEFLRARLGARHGKLVAEPLKGQGSHQLKPLRETNGFIRLGEDSAGFHEGETVEAIPLYLPI
jgi:molybdopterin molybdotransferase